MLDFRVQAQEIYFFLTVAKWRDLWLFYNCVWHRAAQLPRDDNGETPLIRASRNNHIKVVKSLLWAGADPNEIGGTWQKFYVFSMFFLTCENHLIQSLGVEASICYPMLSPGGRQSPLMVAAYHGYVELMKRLLGALLTKVDLRASRQSVTALFMALKHPEAVKAGRQTR